MLEEKLINWLRLALIPAIGPVRARRFLERFFQPDKILSASQKEIASVLGSLRIR
jgi:excinuclease UvrABC nuclease subunit